MAKQEDDTDKSRTRQNSPPPTLLATPSLVAGRRRRRKRSTDGKSLAGSTVSTTKRIRVKNARPLARRSKNRTSDKLAHATADASSLLSKSPVVEEVRRARAEFFQKPPPQRNAIKLETMKYVGESVVRERIPEDELKYYMRRKPRSASSVKDQDMDRIGTRRTNRVTETSGDGYENVYTVPREDTRQSRQHDTILEESSSEDERDKSKDERKSTPKSRHRRSESTRDTHRQTTSRSKVASTVGRSSSSRIRYSETESKKSPQRSSSVRETPRSTRRSSHDDTHHRASRDHSRPSSSQQHRLRDSAPLAPTRRQSEPIWAFGQRRRGSESISSQPDNYVYSEQQRDRPEITRTTSLRENKSTPQLPVPHSHLQRNKTVIRSKDTATGNRKASVGPDRSAGKQKEVEKDTKKTTPFFSMFGPPALKIEKKVSCLTCGSDDILYLKTAKLSCGHRMCHDCLRRIFTMSVTDPAHMPPKCCNEEHIPLRHVDKLFDSKFKNNWNRKYEEYTTKNRLYCPSRNCGEWIKPHHIHPDPHYPGRKFGKCKRCDTKVCITCNGKYHPSNKECPKDAATVAFVEVAKKEGWQRCYNCSAMVELKEGCNHMTCRCTAEFCMICGNKWKSCDCPWFNYQAIDADRINHMNIPEARQHQVRYGEEMERRREQEQRDEALARRLQVLGLDDSADPAAAGGIMNFGNAVPVFLNENFVRQARNVLTGNFRNAQAAAADLLYGRNANPTVENHIDPDMDSDDSNIDPDPFASGAPYRVAAAGNAPRPPAAPLRTATSASRAFNRRVRRPSERVVPGRDPGVGYAEEAARHRPIAQRGGNGTGRGGNGNTNGRNNTNNNLPPNNNVGHLGRTAAGDTGLIGAPGPDVPARIGRIEAWRHAVV